MPMLGITLPGSAAFCQLRITEASPLTMMVMFNRFIVAINESWNSLSLFAAFSGVAQSVLTKPKGFDLSLGSAPGMLLKNHGHMSPAKAGFTFMACTCTSMMGRCFLVESWE